MTWSNNRLDSYTNLIEHPGVGMLFMIPGLVESLRVNGTASISIDAAPRERCAVDGRVPKLVIGVEVTECFIHCGAAFRRAAVWDPNTWPAATDRPSPAAMLKEHTRLDVPVEAIEADLADYYDHAIWLVGGDDDE